MPQRRIGPADSPLLDVHGLEQTLRSQAAASSRPPSIVTRRRRHQLFDRRRRTCSAWSANRAAAKTTTGRCVLRLDRADSGDGAVPRCGRPGRSRERACAWPRRHLQIVFQDPYSSLNPRMRVGDDRRGAAGDPPHWRRAPTGRRASRELFDLVGLDAAHISTLSTRVQRRTAAAHRPRARARAESVVPRADEPVSALDVSVQAQVVNLLLDLQQRLADVSLHRARSAAGRHICTRVAVMYRGKIVEMGRARVALRRTAASLHARAAVRDSGADPDAPRYRIVMDPASVQSGR